MKTEKKSASDTTAATRGAKEASTSTKQAEPSQQETGAGKSKAEHGAQGKSQQTAAKEESKTGVQPLQNNASATSTSKHSGKAHASTAASLKKSASQATTSKQSGANAVAGTASALTKLEKQSQSAHVPHSRAAAIKSASQSAAQLESNPPAEAQATGKEPFTKPAEAASAPPSKATATKKKQVAVKELEKSQAASSSNTSRSKATFKKEKDSSANQQPQVQPPTAPQNGSQSQQAAPTPTQSAASRSKQTSAKATPKPSTVDKTKNNATSKQLASGANSSLAAGSQMVSSSTKGQDKAAKDQLPKDKWPHLLSAADWNREEKEREIRQNLKKFGIDIDPAPQATASSMKAADGTAAAQTSRSARESAKQAKASKHYNQYPQELRLEQQYQQQNFATLTSFDLNKEIRVGARYQIEVTREEYPGERPPMPEEAPTERQVLSEESADTKNGQKGKGAPAEMQNNPEEDEEREEQQQARDADGDDVRLPLKRQSAPESAERLLSQEEARVNEVQRELKRARHWPGQNEEPKRALPKLISYGTYGEDSEEMQEYLELCDFIMREASSNLNGMLLRGSSQYQEKAMNILTQHNYNYDMAKFSILYPTVLLIPEQRNKFLKAIKEDETLLGKIVREAIIDLKGCKQDEIDEVVSELRQALSERIKPEELKVFQRKFDKMQIKFPEDVELKLQEAEEFSRQIKKLTNPAIAQEKRLTLAQLEQKQIEARAQCLETPEILKLDAQVANAHEWLAEVKESLQGEFQLRALERLVKAGKSLAVNFGEPYDQACQRLQMSLDLQKRIQATFKSCKTRKAVQAPTDDRDPGSSAKQRVIAATKSNFGMYQEQLNLDLQKEGQSLRVTFKELDDLNASITNVNKWKANVSQFLEQPIKEQMRKRLKFKNHLNEAKQLKLGMMPQVVRLQQQFDYVEWRESVNAFWRRAIKDNQATLGADAELVEEVQEEEDSVRSSIDDSSSSFAGDANDSDEDDRREDDSELNATGQQAQQRCTGDVVVRGGLGRQDAAMHTPDKQQRMQHSSQSRSQSRSKSKAHCRLPPVQETKTARVQGLTFTLIKTVKGDEFAELSCPRKKSDITVLRQLIEEMIAKGFYTNDDQEDHDQEESASASEEQHLGTRQLQDNQPEQASSSSASHENEHDEKQDEEMKDESADRRGDAGTPKEEGKQKAPERLAPIHLDSESGELKINDDKFHLAEKPYPVRKLLQSYQECKEYLEQVAEVIEDITEIQESTGSLNHLLASQAADQSMDLIDIHEMHRIWTTASVIIVHVPNISELFTKIQRVAEQETKVKDLRLSSLDDLKLSFAEVLACCRTGVKTKAFADFYDNVQPKQLWCHKARSLVKEYYKTIEVKHNKLCLIDSSLVSKPFERKNPFKQEAQSESPDLEDAVMSDEQNNRSNLQTSRLQQTEEHSGPHQPKSQQQPSNGGKKKMSDYQSIGQLMEQAKLDDFKIIRATNEFQHLEALKAKISTINLETESLIANLDKEKSDLSEQAQLLNKIDGLLALGMPMDPVMHQTSNRKVKLQKWKLRLARLKSSKTVTLKQIESLLKEARSHVVQDDPECKQAAMEAEKQYQLCKEWLLKFEQVEDYNDLQAVQSLIDSATNDLGFVLEEFTSLKDDHYESLKQIKEGLDVLFKEHVGAKDGDGVGDDCRVATQENLKDLIALKQDMLDDDEIDVSMSADTKPQLVKDYSPQFDQDTPSKAENLLEQPKGDDIELLQSMAQLVQVWRTISQRALTAALHAAEPPSLPVTTITLRQSSKGHYALELTEQRCEVCKNQVINTSSQVTLQCQTCKGSFHMECILLRQIVCHDDFSSSSTNFSCFACQIRARADATILSEGTPERFSCEQENQYLFQRRRQRLSIEQVIVLIEDGENLLPTVYLPELEQLKTELSRAQSVQQRLVRVSSRPIGVSDYELTGLIFESETLIVDLNKAIWQAVLHIQQLRRLSAVQKTSSKKATKE